MNESCTTILPECADRLARIEEQGKSQAERDAHQTKLLEGMNMWLRGNGKIGAETRISMLEKSESDRSDEKKWFKRLVIGAIVAQSIVLVIFAIKGI